jgi:hypothetical protein
VSLKLVEVLVLVCAGALFVWWQMRDLRIAREQTRRQKADAVIASAAKHSTHASAANQDGAPQVSSAQADGAPHAP